MHLPKLTIVRSFKTRVAGSRNSCVITLTFISLVFQQKYGIRGWFCWFSRYKMVCVRSVRLLLILAFFSIIATISSSPPFRIELKRKNVYLATCIPPIRYAFASFTERYRPCELCMRITVLSKTTKSNACDFSFAMYGNSLVAARGISKSESHCRY